MNNNNKFIVPSLKDIILEYFAEFSLNVQQFTELVQDYKDKESLISIYEEFLVEFKKNKETDLLIKDISCYLGKIGNEIDKEIKFVLLSECAKILGRKILRNILLISALIDKYTRS